MKRCSACAGTNSTSPAATSHSRPSTTKRDGRGDRVDLVARVRLLLVLDARPVQLDVERAVAKQRREQRAFIVEAGERFVQAELHGGAGSGSWGSGHTGRAIVARNAGASHGAHGRAIAIRGTSHAPLAMHETPVSIRETTMRLRGFHRELHRNLINDDYDPASSIDSDAVIRSALRHCRPSPTCATRPIALSVTVNATPR